MNVMFFLITLYEHVSSFLKVKLKFFRSLKLFELIKKIKGRFYYSCDTR